MPNKTSSATKQITKPSPTKRKAVRHYSRLNAFMPWMLLFAGIVGIVCSLFLTYDQIQIWKHPNYIPACNLNPIVSCGSVIDSKQGEIFGIPAPFFGLIAFPVLATVGLAMIAGAKFKRWFWQLAELAGIGGIGFALWLFWLSVYRVHALCPFCLTVDVVVYTMVWYLTLYNLSEGYIALPKRLVGVGDFARRHHLDILVTWFILIIAFILHHFWYYFGQHL